MDIRREDGIAMIVAMMAMLLMTALGLALVLTTSSETMIAGNFRNSSEALYAADAVLERSMDDILTVADWNKMIDPTTPGGMAQSAFIDGKPLSDERRLPDGSTIKIDEAVNMANCQRTAPLCTDADMNANTAERPWATNNPRWRAYAYGYLTDMLPASDTINSPFYVVLMVADDPSETDGNPARDGVTPCPAPPADQTGCNPGTGVLALRAEAFGPNGAHKIIEVTVARTDTTELERGYTGQRGQDEQNRRARKSAVQTPGKALTMQTLDMAGGGIH
jgi:type IV pilus assembly PilX-like protein